MSSLLDGLVVWYRFKIKNIDERKKDYQYVKRCVLVTDNINFYGPIVKVKKNIVRLSLGNGSENIGLLKGWIYHGEGMLPMHQVSILKVPRKYQQSNRNAWGSSRKVPRKYYKVTFL